MEIKLKNNTIDYFQFLKLFTIGWVFGLGTIFFTFGLIGFTINILIGNFEQSIKLLGIGVMGPFILLFQSPFFGSLAYLGIRVFSKFKKLEFVSNT